MSRPVRDLSGLHFGNLSVKALIPTPTGRKYLCVCNTCHKESQHWDTYLYSKTNKATKCQHCDAVEKIFYFVSDTDLFTIKAPTDELACIGLPQGTYRLFVNFDNPIQPLRLAHREARINSLIAARSDPATHP